MTGSSSWKHRDSPYAALFGSLVLVAVAILATLATKHLLLRGFEGSRTHVYLFFVAVNTFTAMVCLAAILGTVLGLQYRLHDSDITELFLSSGKKTLVLGAIMAPFLAWLLRDALYFFHALAFDGYADVADLWFPLDRADGFLASFPLVPALFLAAFAEEMFRAYLLVHVKKHVGAITAVIVSSILFAMIHVHYPLELRVFILLFTSGALLAVTILVFRSVWPAVFAHTLSNFMVLISMIGKLDFGNHGVTVFDPSSFPFH